ncbi:hypothetical protein CPB84DRAFT_1765969 [Gymnopilus junonius]|uniref:Translation machinery-associated protein 16 n=1 Tax=Gymnopilus junonius TaxID=109634 RepID=A0A9P5TSG8_GYMJU|nr:hypothetical protein CPB84DRAFT_1765969 [Gymnopilus junonius]
MAPTAAAKAKTSTASKEKKEKIFHPASRKADQLARHAIRKGKLGNLATKRSQKHNSLADLYGFFFHAIPEEGVLSMEDFHHVIRDIWLTRFDNELEAEKSSRRKGRPKSAKEVKLEEMKLREAEIYRTGMEVIDLTHPPTAELFRRWDQKEVAFIQLLRFVRISSTTPDVLVVSRPGKHSTIVESTTVSEGEAMDIGEEPGPSPHFNVLQEPPRFSSTMMAMDDLPR